MKKYLKPASKAILAVIFLGLGVNAFLIGASKQVDKKLTDVKYGVFSTGAVQYRPVVRLHNIEKNKFFCSAVVIDSHYALTAAHCVIDSMDIMESDEIAIYDEIGMDTGVTAIPAAVDLNRDVALIRGDFTAFQHAIPNFSGKGQEVIMGRVVAHCGYPGGGDLFCSAGVVTGAYIFRMVVHGSQVYQGMSGGAVFDNNTGEVLGVNSAAGSDGNLYGPIIGLDAVFGIKE